MKGTVRAIKIYAVAALSIALTMVVDISAAHATTCMAPGTTIGGVICNTVRSVNQVPGLLTGLAYLTGIILGAMGIAKMYEHVQNPNQTSVWEPLKRFLAGGCMFALPILLESLQNMIDGGNAVGGMRAAETGFAGATSGTGLDAMVVRLMRDIWRPMNDLIWAFCYLGGLILLLIGIMRLLKTAQEGPRGPGGMGTIMTFFTAGALLSAPDLLGSWTNSMFTGGTMHFANMQFTSGMQAAEVNHVHAVISSIIAFVAVLGWISFIRGWFIIRDVAEGNQQASMMAGITHLFGGALAVNLGPVMNAVQTTLGLTAYGVNFS